MKRNIAFLMILAVIFAMTGCGDTSLQSQTVPETVPADSVSRETLWQTSDSELLDEIIRAFGMPFRLHSPTNRDLYEITLYADHALREVIRKNGDSEEQDGLGWEIEDEQLKLTGAWEERFLIDLETMTAVSVLDGREYRLYTKITLPDVALEKITGQVGLPFSLCRSGNEVCRFDLYEDHASREADGQMLDDLRWEIDDWGQLNITGAWEEHFSINFENLTVVSKADGKIYEILPLQE